MHMIRRAPHRAAVAIAHAVAFINKIKMRIQLHDMDRVLIRKRVDTADVDRMIAAQHHRHRPSGQNFAHAIFDIGQTFRLIGVNDIGVANIDHLHTVWRQIDGVVFMVIRPAMAKRKQRGRFAYCARAKAGTCAKLRAHIQWCTHHCDITLDVIPIQTQRTFGKTANANEGQVKASGIVAVHLAPVV